MDTSNLMSSVEKSCAKIRKQIENHGVYPIVFEQLLAKVRIAIQKLSKEQTPASICQLGKIIYHLGMIDKSNCDHYFKLAFDFFEKAANEHYLPALRNLGECYLEGEGVEKDTEKGLDYLKRAFSAGDTESGIELSMYYFFGVAVKKDLEVSLKYLSDAAKTGNPNALFHMGLYYYSLDDFEAALTWFQRGADAGSAGAMYSLGVLCLYGKGVEKDTNKALSLFVQSAAKDNADACYILAMMYIDGWYSIDKNETEGLSYLQKAMALGSEKALEKYGELLIEGLLVPKDVNCGVNALSYAAECGSENAKLALIDFYLSSSEETEEKYKKAFHWLNMLKDKDEPQIQCIIALMYLKGAGTEKDVEKGVKLLKKYIAADDTSLQEMLDHLDDVDDLEDLWKTLRLP